MRPEFKGFSAVGNGLVGAVMLVGFAGNEVVDDSIIGSELVALSGVTGDGRDSVGKGGGTLEW